MDMENQEKKKMDYRWVIIIILVIVGAGLYFYQSYQLNHLRKDLSAQADSALSKQNKQLLKLSAKPLVWAIRSEMLRNNLDEINVFNTDLVKERNVTEITLLNAAGKIINSTDKKLEDTMAKPDYLALLKSDTVSVNSINDSLNLLVAPVMGYQSKLGAVILKYRVEKFQAQ